MTAPLRLELRDYQREAIDRMFAAEARGVRKQLGVAATGLGKTVVFCAFAQARGGRTLILAHRDELVTQAVRKVQEIWPGVEVGIVKAGDNEVHSQVVVASVQTLSRPKRLDQFINAENSLLHDVGPLDLVVVDEAHHSAAESYRRILDGLGAGGWVCSHCGAHPGNKVSWCESGCGSDYMEMTPGPLLLGVTATPDRGDGKGLDDLYDEIVWNYDILWGIRSGFLSDLQARRIVLDSFNIDDVKVRRGDYDAGSAGRALEDAQAPAFIAAAWQEHAADRQTLVFTPTVEVARQCADEFKRRGVKAAMLCGETPLDERRAMLRLYAEAELQVIANCAVLTEGFDEPRTDCIIVARPTKSRALFTQMIGRGTRRHPAKDNLLVLDVVGASNLHSLVTVPSLFGLEPEVAAQVEGQNLTDAVGEFERKQVVLGKMRAEEADLFRRVRQGGIAWLQIDADRYERPLRIKVDDEYVAHPTVVLVRKNHDDDQSWLCGTHDTRTNDKRVLIAGVELELAQSVGEDYARKSLGSSARLINIDAAWRKKRPSKKQKAAAHRWRVKDIDSFKTAGELSDAIDAKVHRVNARAS